jgi:hypothetical protein
MAFEYTNKNNISLALAVFLMHDSYDYDGRDNVISATGLLKSIRQIVLAQQNKNVSKTVDIVDLVPSRMGSAIHTGCEEAWSDRKNILEALKLFGAADTVTDSIKINPETVESGDMPVYVEQRAEKEVLNFVISGKYDLVLDGVLNDYKSTSVWTYIFDSNKDNYIKQGSIYKWLSPDKITSDIININYIFTDWSAARARQDQKSYPQQRVITKEYPLWSPEETEQWITSKLETYISLIDTAQEDLPECTDEELWASETVYKYYKNPNKLDRSTKNFGTMNEALMRKSADGDVGIIKEVPGEVKACRYCSVVSICTQAEGMLASGRLTL